MNRQEFLNELRECLTDQVTEGEISDSLNYYDNYITEEEGNGKTEEQVLASLGSPRLIAHSIIDAHEEAETGSAGGYYDVEDDRYEQDGESFPSDQMKATAIKIGVIALIIAIIILAVFVLQILLPFIIVGAIALWLYRKFSN